MPQILVTIKRWPLLMILLFASFGSSAQGQDARLFLYNAAFGGITAGAGAVFNKPKGVDWKRTFAKAFWQGSIGGALHYSGKKTLYLINKHQEITYALPAKLLHAAGNSIIENAAYRRPFLQSWNLDYGPVRFDFSFGGPVPFKARLLPSALYAVPLAAKPGSSLDVKLSLLSGCISFQTSRYNMQIAKVGTAAGICFGRSLIYSTNYGDGTFRIIAHELGHHFQFSEFQVFNTWLSPLAAGSVSPAINKAFTSYIYFDAPYKVIPYQIEGRHPHPHYYRNFFELEVERFATNQDVSY